METKTGEISGTAVHFNGNETDNTHFIIAVLCDRLRGIQNGPYACRENAHALTHLEEAQHWLQQRTLERMRRGVEGSHKV